MNAISCLSIFRHERAAKRKRISGAVAAPSDTPVGSPPSTIASPSPDIDFTEAAEECETDSHGHSYDDIPEQL